MNNKKHIKTETMEYDMGAVYDYFGIKPPKEQKETAKSLAETARKELAKFLRDISVKGKVYAGCINLDGYVITPMRKYGNVVLCITKASDENIEDYFFNISWDEHGDMTVLLCSPTTHQPVLSKHFKTQNHVHNKNRIQQDGEKI